ncbi:MAG: hypothetical protein QG670_919 [Thermoproteota archaeon]|nr:hypothetical protein [Thermoproteota archaeon]
MSKKRTNDYAVVVIFLLTFALLMYFSINTFTAIGWNSRSIMLTIIALPFGVFGFGSLWDPDKFMPTTEGFANFLRKLSKSREKKSKS